MRQRFSTWLAIGVGLMIFILALIFAIIQSM